MRIWVITDTHFNHEKIKEYENRPDGFEDLIISNWNKLVSEDDLVIHLGDVIFSQAGELLEIMMPLNGRKVAVRGNHDKKAVWLMEHGFEFACDGLILGEVYFTHKPAEILPEGCTINLHGHTHGNEHREDEYKKQSWHKEFHIENSFKPVLLQELLTSNKEKGK